MSPRHAVPVVVQRRDYEPLASMGPAAVRWAVCCALRRTFKVGAKFPLQTATLLVRADGRSGASAPYDWEGLGSFVEEGGTVLLQCHLPGGMDPGSELLQKTQLNEDSIPWDAVDSDVIRVQRGEIPAEALAVLKGKDLLCLLEHARSNPCPIPDLAAADGSGGDARPPQ